VTNKKSPRNLKKTHWKVMKMQRIENRWPQGFLWVDCQGAAKEDIQRLAEEFHIPPHELSHAMDPENLVKCDFVNDACLFIARVYDPEVQMHASTVQDLTTKLIILYRKDVLLTLHRDTLPLIARVQSGMAAGNFHPEQLMEMLGVEILNSFDSPIVELEHKMNIIEDRIFKLRREAILREGYLVKRRAAVFKKILKFTSEAFCKMHSRHFLTAESLSELKDLNDHLGFYVDEVFENMGGLINLHISLMSQKTNQASYKTNEIVRVLTIFSIFFLPLNFIAGIYGMNFEHIPELHWQNGYFYVLGLMVMVAVSIAGWIINRGWLSFADMKPIQNNEDQDFVD
jgi:magnesium transporter